MLSRLLDNLRHRHGGRDFELRVEELLLLWLLDDDLLGNFRLNKLVAVLRLGGLNDDLSDRWGVVAGEEGLVGRLECLLGLGDLKKGAD